MEHDDQPVGPFGLVAIGLTGLGGCLALGILLWPGPSIEPGGLPGVAFLAFEPMFNALRALALSAFFALPAAAISLVLRERWTATVVPVALVDALVLAVAGVFLR